MIHTIIDYENWDNAGHLNSYRYTCGYCGETVGSSYGYTLKYDNDAAIYLCPYCGRPSFMENHVMTPGSAYGQPITNLPDTVQSLYDEARNSYQAGAFTGVILICRKILANVAVYYGAEDGQRFVKYVDYLVENGYVPEKSREWIDKIRTEGNSATHDQTAKNKDDAQRILDFVQMLLLINFKFNSDYNTSENNN